MVGTRSCVDAKKRVTRRGQPEEEPVAHNDTVASTAPTIPAPAPSNASAPVALMVSGSWSPPPSIGEIEAVLKSSGRTQHRISRIEVRADCAFVEVHPEDVPHCTGVLERGGLQLRVSVVGDGVGNMTMSAPITSPPPITSSPAKRASPHVNAPSVASVGASALSAKKRAKVDQQAPPEVAQPVQPATAPTAYVAPPPAMDFPGQEHLMMRTTSAMSTSTVGSPGLPGLTAAQMAGMTKAQIEDDKQRRLYRVGLSYRCGRCGKPKKGHVCDVPEGEEGSQQPFGDGLSLSPQPAILATTVRKGTPPALLGSPLGVSHARVPAESSPLSRVEVSGEASTIFKDMVAALGENTSSMGLGSPVVSASSPGGPPPIVASSGISPLAASAIAAGSVSSAAVATVAPVATAAGQGGESQLSEMDMMLADLAFSARPPPVMTPGEDESTETVQAGLGSLSPSNFSPGSMIHQLINTPGASNWAAGVGMDAALLGAVPPAASVRRATVIAQPTAV